MNSKSMSLKKKISISQGGVVFLIIAVMTLIIYTKSTDMVKEISLDDAENMAKSSGQKVGGIFNNAFDTAQALADSLKALKKLNPDRKIVNEILKTNLERNSSYIGVWCGWEPDAFDGKDAEFINKEGSDDTGRLVPYWSRAGGIHIEPLAGYEDADSYYDAPRKARKPYVTDPYFYTISGKEYYLVTASVPIIVNGQVVGVAGVDFTMDEIGKQIGAIKPYEVGYAFLCSTSSTIVAHKNKKFLGKKIRTLDNKIGDIAESNIPTGKVFKYTKTSTSNNMESYYVHVPVNFGKTETPWSLAIVIPMDKIMEGPATLRNYSIIIGLIGIAIVIGLTVFLSNRAFDPIIKMKDMMQEAAEGEADMTRRMAVGAMDEIGETAYWFNIFVERMQNLIKEVKLNAQAVSSASLEISSSTEELSATVEEQSSQAQSVSTALSELSTTFW